MLRKILGSCIWVGILALAPASAQNAPNTDATGSRPHLNQHIQEIYNQLHLTDEQKTQLEANKKQHRARMENFRQQTKAYRQAFQAELMNPAMDVAKLKQIHRQMKDVQDQMEDDKLNSILAVRSILTPVQFTAFVNLMHRHKQEHGD